MSSPQRPSCSRRRPCIPAAVPAQWRRLLIFGNPDITVHGMFQWKLPLAERPTFLRQSHSSGGRQGAYRQADDGFACSHIGTGKTFNRFCIKMLSVTALWNFRRTKSLCGGVPYGRRPDSVRHGLAMAFRTPEDLILYGASGTAVTGPPRAHH